MGFESAKLKQLKICFLFMCADGEISPAETSYIDDIISKEDLSESDIEEFQDFCKEMKPKVPFSKPKKAIDKIDKVLEEYTPDRMDETMKAQTIWTLINLGYADGEYCKAEKKVVKHLVKRWEIDPVLVAEFNDTAETILALTKQKEWIQTTSRPYEEIDGMIQEINRNIASMFENVEISISEAYIGADDEDDE